MDAVTPAKNSAESSFSTVLVTDAPKYLKTHPIIIEYPIAIPSEPISGIQPKIFPSFSCFLSLKQ